MNLMETLKQLEEELDLLHEDLVTTPRGRHVFDYEFLDVHYKGEWVFVIESQMQVDGFGITATDSDNMGYGLTSPDKWFITKKEVVEYIKTKLGV